MSQRLGLRLIPAQAWPPPLLALQRLSGQAQSVRQSAEETGARGVVGKEVRWDEMLRFKCDIDCCLGELLRNRIIWHESRFCFLQARDKNLGGNSRFRSPERIAAEKRYLQSKWKAHLRLDTYQSQDRVQVAVERRQRVDL